MAYQEYPVSLEFNQYIKCFWSLDKAASDYYSPNMPPDSYVELVINCDSKLTRLADIDLPRVFLIGLRHKPTQLQPVKSCHLIAVRLHAWAVYPLTGIHPQATVDTMIPLGGIWQWFASALQKTVASHGFLAAVRQFEQFIAGVLTDSPRHDPTICKAGELLYQFQGQLRVRDLAAQCDFSLNQFERRFRLQVGISPKAFTQLIRLETVRDCIIQGTSRTLAEIACQFGYTDQAHMIRDFKMMTGITPGQFASYITSRREKL